MNDNHNGGSRTTALLGTVAVFGVLLWIAAQLYGMSIPDFTVHVVGAFVADHPWTLLIPAAIIVLMVFDDILDRLICSIWDAVTRPFKDRAKAIANNPDAQAQEILAARQIN